MEQQVDGSAALVILDYSNVFPGRSDEDEFATSVQRLRSIAKAIIDRSTASRVLLRLYGGWMQDGRAHSNAASRAQLLTTQADPFPVIADGRVVHGRLELATALLSFPEYVLPDTYRIRGAVPRLILRDGAAPKGCAAADTCPALILKRFTKGPRKLCPVSECPVTCKTAFVHAEQKMVDTHMAADILHAATAHEYEFVAVVSGDSDVVPPLLQAARSVHGRLALAPNSGFMPQHFVHVLRDAGVEIVEAA